MGLLLLRYGEIALKGQNRTYFFRKLRRNVRLCLKANGIVGEVWQEGQRVYVETEQVEEAIEAVRKVFGLVSLSPVHVVAADLDAVAEEAVAVALREGVNQDRSFRVKARRSDKSFRHISPEVERHVGAAIAERTGASVDLSKQADAEIGVEIQRGRALIFGQVIAGMEHVRKISGVDTQSEKAPNGMEYENVPVKDVIIKRMYEYFPEP